MRLGSGPSWAPRTAFVAALGTLCTAGLAPAQQIQLHLAKRVAVVDEAVAIVVSGLPPHTPFIVRSARTDSLGHLWQAFADFRADDDGRADLSRVAPINGSYSGVHAMGLFTSMDVGGALLGRLRYPFAWSDTLRTVITADAGEGRVAVDTLLQLFAGPGVTASVIRQNGVVGTLFRPGSAPSGVGVLVLGGSEGGLSSEDVAAQLASHGHTALAIAYFAADGLPTALDRIPLEYFGEALAVLRTTPSVARDRLVLFGTSKGSEAALAYASFDSTVRAVVAYVPSSVVWSCICTETHSSWTLNGVDLPFIPAGTDPSYHPPQGSPLRPSVNYTFRKHGDTASATRIAVERIHARLFLVGAGDDGVWPSGQMTNEILAQRRRAGRTDDVAIVYPDAGHLIGKAFLPGGSPLIAGGRIHSGGSPSANADAQEDAWPRVLAFLDELLPVEHKDMRLTRGRRIWRDGQRAQI